MVYHTIDQLFRMTMRLFGLESIDYDYKPINQRKYYENVLDLITKDQKYLKKYENRLPSN